MWALRVEGKQSLAERGTLDLFGLLAFMPNGPPWFGRPIAGNLAYVVRGQGRHLLDILDAAHEWWGHYLGLVLKGRPPGTGTWADRPHFLSAVEHAVESIRSGGGKVTQEKVAELLSTDDRTLRRWFRDYGTTWEKMRHG